MIWWSEAQWHQFYESHSDLKALNLFEAKYFLFSVTCSFFRFHRFHLMVRRSWEWKIKNEMQMKEFLSGDPFRVPLNGEKEGRNERRTWFRHKGISCTFRNIKLTSTLDPIIWLICNLHPITVPGPTVTW